MLTYKYTARNISTGEKIRAEVSAESVKVAARLIHQEGLVPIEISLKDGEGGSYSRFLGRVKAKDRILFTRQLSTLINAGLPLFQSLHSVVEQSSSKSMRYIGSKIISDVESGMPLSAALAAYPEVFNQVYVSLVAAGETSGTLDKSLDRLAVQQEKDAEILSKVRGAMVYPVIVIFVMVLVVTFMVVKVLPQVEVLYQDLPGNNLPFITQLLLGVSHIITRYWWVVAAFIGLTSVAFSRWLRTLGGKTLVDTLKMRVWLIGPLYMKLYMARFARTGSTLVAAGVPLVQMLEVSARSISNVHIEKSLNAAIDKVRGGKSLSSVLYKDRNFLELVPNMLKIGEESGATEQMLQKTAEYFEKEVDNEIKTISTVIEPFMMIILGIVALVIVAAVLLPVYSLAGKTIIN